LIAFNKKLLKMIQNSSENCTTWMVLASEGGYSTHWQDLEGLLQREGEVRDSREREPMERG